MSTITPVWTENQTISGFNDTTLGAGATTSGVIDLDTLGYDCIFLQIKAIMPASLNTNQFLKIFSSPNSGTTKDNIPLFGYKIAKGLTTEIISFIIKNVPYIEVAVTNSDGSNTSNISAIYAGRKWDNI